MDWQSEFQLNSDISYLNHAAVSPWPKRTAQAVTNFSLENSQLGATNYPQWLQKEALLRRQLQQLINAPRVEEIALLKNTSEGLSFIAYGLQWHGGENIIITDEEFPSNRIVWESLASKGVEIRYANIANEQPEQNIINLMDNNTRLVSVSSVQYASGLKLDLAQIGTACRTRNILYCIDAIQSLGAEAFDCQHYNADFVVAEGHKWMLGPEGLALFYCRQEVMDQLALTEFGWHMIEHQGDYDRTDWTPANSARRFECGSPNMLGAYGLSASLSLLLQLGLEQVQSLLQSKIDYLLAQLNAVKNLQLHSPKAIERRGGIINFTIAGQDSHELYNQLRKANVICAYRGKGIRFSPHFYTPYEAMDRAVEKLQGLL